MTAPLDRRAGALVRVLVIAAVVVALATGTAAGASPGHPDPAFGDDGVLQLGLDRLSLLPVPSGSVVVFGVESDGTVVARQITPAGDLDPGFGVAGRAVLGPGDPDHVGLSRRRFDVIGDLDPTGRIVVVNTINEILHRLTPEGLPDPTWPTGGVPVGGVFDLDVDSAGRVLLATPDGLLRLTSAGAPDPSFGSGGRAGFPSGSGPAVFPVRVEADPADWPVVGLQIGSSCGPRWFCSSAIARLTPSGAIDTGFRSPAAPVSLFDVASDGSILVGTGMVLRLATDGTQIAATAASYSAAIAPGVDGAIFARSAGSVVALRHDLSVDASFGHCGHALSSDPIADLAVAGDRLLVAHATSIEAFQLQPGGPAIPYVPGRAVIGVEAGGSVASRGPACAASLQVAPAAPVVDAVSTPSYEGLWMVAADGGVFTFGDAQFLGSAGAVPLAAPVTAMAATTGGDGYWLVARDGGVFAYGDAPYLGRVGGGAEPDPAEPVVDIVAHPSGTGYAALRYVPGTTWWVHAFGIDDPDVAGQLPSGLPAVALVLA